MSDREANQVFNDKQNLRQQIMQPSDEKMKQELGFEIPTLDIDLPSKGRVYPEGSGVDNVDKVEIYAMTARQEDILTNRALARKGTLITHLLNSAFKMRGLDSRNMLTGDRNAIMVGLRVSGYGQEYNVEVRCPACSEQSRQGFDLAKLPIQRLGIEPMTPGTNLFEWKLPVTKRRIHFKFLTGVDEEELSTVQDRQRKAGLSSDSSNLITQGLKAVIVAIEHEGEMVDDRTVIDRFVRYMPAFDSKAFRKYMSDNEPSVVMKGNMVCPFCAESSEVDMPLGADFFWPGSE